MTLNMRNGRHIFPELKTLIHELICAKKNIYPASIKNNNGAVVMRKNWAMQTEPTTP